MSNKRRRTTGNRGNAARRTSGRARAGGEGFRPRSAGKRRTTAPTPSRGRRPPPRERPSPPDDAPSALYSVARGLLTTMASPALVGLSIVAALLLWGALTALGSPPQPSGMNVALSMPPVHSTLGLSLLYSGRELSGGQVASLVGFTFLVLFQAAYMTIAVSLARSAHDHLPTSAALASAWALLRARILWMLVVELGFASAALLLAFLPLLLGPPAYPIGVMAVLYLTAFVAPGVVLSGLTAREALRASYGIARMTGTRHGFMVAGYVLFVIVVFFGPGRPGVVTPTVIVWAYALLAGLLHLSVLSAFVHRWGVLAPVILPEAARKDERAAPALQP